MSDEYATGLVGSYFHSFTVEDDGCELVAWQGQVIERLENGSYFVQTFEWLLGYESRRQVFTLEQMSDWHFYDSAEAMNSAYHTMHERRAARHYDHLEGELTPEVVDSSISEQGSS